MIPGRLGGDSALVRWLNQLRDAVEAYRVNFVLGGRLTSGGAGTLLKIDPQRGPQIPYLMRLKSVEDDYVVCRTWDGTNESSGDIPVAKPWKLRTSLTTESKYGVDHYYTYGTGPSGLNLLRTDKWPDAGGSGGSEDQLVTPGWEVDQEIEVYFGPTTAVDGSSVPIFLRMSAPWRQWAKATS